jgi:sugar/nucleoside kinase (ribokinase family)
MSDGATIDVVGLGNALVDVVSQEHDDFLGRFEMPKGGMQLIDTDRVEAIYAAMAPVSMMSGGSAANTIAGIASFGGHTAFIGAVADDELGEVYRHNLDALGVVDGISVRSGGDPTGRCLVIVTPDAERTMNTHLGVSAQFGPDDVAADLVTAARVTYLEGFLWDQPAAKEAFRRAAELAAGAERQVALSLSDSFCVDRHRPSFLDLIENQVHILFANAAEIAALYETSDLEDAFAHVSKHVEVAAITLGADGCVVIANGETQRFAASPVDDLVDTNGAGDAFAAGFLFGFTHFRGLDQCATLGSRAAAEVISHLGPRAQRSLAELDTDRP